MPLDPRLVTRDVLRGIQGGLTSVSPLVADPGWKGALVALSGLAGLAADLIDHGIEPIEAITEIQSVLPDYRAARDRLLSLMHDRSSLR